ncbi:MAG: photosynthetic reaction center subunit H [Dongiaceae bacterium]
MQAGAITSYIDVAQLALYAFWIFFAGLIFYLRREDKREGYPLESERSGHVLVQGFPAIPSPKTFLLRDGSTLQAPRAEPPQRPIAARPVGGWLGAPMEPTGNPMVDGVGPAAYVERSEVPDTTFEGELRIVPLRVATDYGVDAEDPDPRGMAVIAADGRRAGTVADIWVDRADAVIRYLEVGLADGHRVLLPMTMARVGEDSVKVASILAAQFAAVPALANPDQITSREEDRITAYYAGGHLYATPDRLGPLL